ncbi:MAG: alpha amylase C-terminal domain-containing protein, partial [Alistipes sp.]|nr:alpha amylase C-terminal domain-containing protein [Alistipes sp.]
DNRCRVREAGRYELILSTDERRFGGLERARIGREHFPSPADNGDGTTSPAISIYNTSRTAAVYLLQ